MKILHLAHDALPYSTGGVEVYVARLAAAQRAAGASVELVAARDDGVRNTYSVRRETTRGGPLTTIGHRTGAERFHALRVAFDASRFDRNPRVDRLIAGIVRDAAPDIVHVHHLVHLSTTLLGELARLDIPTVVTLHDYWWLCVAGQLLHEGGPHEPEACGERCLRYLLFNRHKAFGPLAPLFAAYTRARSRHFDSWVRERQRRLVSELGSARLVVAPSRSLAERYRRASLDGSRLEVSDYGTDLLLLTRRLRSRGAGPVRFGFLGRLVPEKGPHLLLQAFHGLGDRASLELFAAPAPNAGYRARLATLARASGAELAGPYAPDEVGEILDRIDALVVPSIWWENSPLVIHEAFAAGVPVIAADAGGMAELVTHEVDGLRFAHGDAAALRGALLRMLEPGVLDRLSAGTVAPRSLADDVEWHLATYARVTAG